MGDRDGEDPQLTDFEPLSDEEEEAATAINLSVEGALAADELAQLGLAETIEVGPNDQTVAEAVDFAAIAEPPKSTAGLALPPEPTGRRRQRTPPTGAARPPRRRSAAPASEPAPTPTAPPAGSAPAAARSPSGFDGPRSPDPDATYRVPPATGDELVIPGRRPMTSVLLIFGAIAALAALVTFAILFWRGAPETTVAGAGPQAMSPDGSTADAATLANTAPPDESSQSTDAGAADAAAPATPDASATSNDAGAFVIEDPEIPRAVRRMRPRVRARRARAQRRIALRLYGRMRYERAEEAWRRALVLAPDNRFTHAGLARTLRALGRTAEADAWQAKADEGAPMRRRRHRRRRRRRRRR